MLDSSLKVPGQLELTPGIVRTLLLGLTPQQVAWAFAQEACPTLLRLSSPRS